MNLAIQRFKVYSKLILIILFLLFILLMIWMNRANRVTVWFLYTFEEINVLWLMFCTALLAILMWSVSKFAFGVVRDLKALKQYEDSQAEKKRQDELMKKLEGQTSGTTDKASPDKPSTDSN